MLAGLVLSHQMSLLTCRQLGLLAAELALGPGDSHALTGSHPQQIHFEFSEHGQHIEEHLGHGVARVVDASAQRQCSPTTPLTQSAWRSREPPSAGTSSTNT